MFELMRKDVREDAIVVVWLRIKSGMTKRVRDRVIGHVRNGMRRIRNGLSDNIQNV